MENGADMTGDVAINMAGDVARDISTQPICGWAQIKVGH